MKRLLLLLVFMSPLVFAEDRGNGGDVFVCFISKKLKLKVYNNIMENRKVPVELKIDPFEDIDFNKDISKVLTLEEYMINNSINNNVFSKKTEKELVKYAVTKISKLNSFGETINFMLKNDMAPKKWIPTYGGIVEINDSNHHIIAPRNCLLVQAALNERIGEKTKVYYEKRLFDKMGDFSKATLRLHEVIYALIRKKVTDSRPARELIFLIYTDGYIDNLTSLDLFDFFSSINYKTKIRNYVMELEDQEVNVDGTRETISLRNGSYRIKTDLEYGFIQNQERWNLKETVINLENNEINSIATRGKIFQIPNLLEFEGLKNYNLTYEHQSYETHYVRGYEKVDREIITIEASEGILHLKKANISINLKETTKLEIDLRQQRDFESRIKSISGLKPSNFDFKKMGIDGIKNLKTEIMNYAEKEDGKWIWIHTKKDSEDFPSEITIKGKTYKDIGQIALKNGVVHILFTDKGLGEYRIK